MERVETKLDGLAEAFGRRRVSLDRTIDGVEGLSPILALQQTFERQITNPFQKQQSAGSTHSSLAGPPAVTHALTAPSRVSVGRHETRPPGAGGRDNADGVTPAVTLQSGFHDPRPSGNAQEDDPFDNDEAELGGKRRGSMDCETDDGVITYTKSNNTAESPAAGENSTVTPSMELGTRSGSRQSREQELVKRMESEMGSQRQGMQSPLGRLVRSQRFDSMVTVVIFLNAIVLGVEVQLRAVSNTSFEWFGHVELMCTSVFTVELFLRLWVHRFTFFTDSHERLWNIYDCFLITASWVGFLIHSMSEASAFFFKAGRVIRMFRVIRVVRTVRFLSQLRVMLVMIMGTLQSLFWVMLILVGLLYCVSIILTQGATDYLNPSDNQVPADYEAVSFMFGSLFQTMYTLFQCMSGGVNWGQASYLMRGPGWAMEVIVVAFVFFTIFAVVNIVNGVFVDGAIQLAKQDRMLFVEKQRLEDRAKEAQLLHLLNAMDENHDNIITFQEFSDSLERQEIIDYFSALHVDIEDAKQFFPLLDLDGCGQVDLFQFVTGMEKLRGEARSADIHIVLHQNKKVMTMLSNLMKLLGGHGDVAY